LVKLGFSLKPSFTNELRLFIVNGWSVLKITAVLPQQACIWNLSIFNYHSRLSRSLPLPSIRNNAYLILATKNFDASEYPAEYSLTNSLA
jgi:hypothetical protein